MSVSFLSWIFPSTLALRAAIHLAVCMPGHLSGCMSACVAVCVLDFLSVLCIVWLHWMIDSISLASVVQLTNSWQLYSSCLFFNISAVYDCIPWIIVLSLRVEWQNLLPVFDDIWENWKPFFSTFFRDPVFENCKIFLVDLGMKFIKFVNK